MAEYESPLQCESHFRQNKPEATLFEENQQSTVAGSVADLDQIRPLQFQKASVKQRQFCLRLSCITQS